MTPALRLLALILSSAAPTALADTILRRIPRVMLQIIKVGVAEALPSPRRDALPLLSGSVRPPMCIPKRCNFVMRVYWFHSFFSTDRIRSGFSGLLRSFSTFSGSTSFSGDVA